MRKTMLALLCIILFGCSLFARSTANDPYIKFHQDSYEIDYGEEIDLLSDRFIKEHKGSITVDDTYFSTKQSGEHNVIYTVVDEDQNMTFDYSITFNVTTAKRYQFTEYPVHKELSYSIDTWQSAQFDPRIKLRNPESSSYERMSITLFPEDTKEILFLSLTGTSLPEWYNGTYEYIGQNQYKFEVFKYTTSCSGDVCVPVKDERKSLIGYFYHDENYII